MDFLLYVFYKFARLALVRVDSVILNIYNFFYIKSNYKISSLFEFRFSFYRSLLNRNIFSLFLMLKTSFLAPFLFSRTLTDFLIFQKLKPNRSTGNALRRINNASRNHVAMR